MGFLSQVERDLPSGPMEAVELKAICHGLASGFTALATKANRTNEWTRLDLAILWSRVNLITVE